MEDLAVEMRVLESDPRHAIANQVICVDVDKQKWRCEQVRVLLGV